MTKRTKNAIARARQRRRSQAEFCCVKLLFEICAFFCSGVTLGAFGAHAMKKFLEARGSTKTWETAVQYHLVHSVALLVIAVSQRETSKPSPSLEMAAKCFAGGTLLFSGSLYGLSMGGPKILG